MTFYSDSYIRECKEQRAVAKTELSVRKAYVQLHQAEPGFSWDQTVARLITAAMRVESLTNHIADMIKTNNVERLVQQRATDQQS